MSKRPRRNRKSKASADRIGLDELPLAVVKSPEFRAFAARLDQDLETLVSRWGHVAAPFSLHVRRPAPLPIRRPAEPA